MQVRFLSSPQPTRPAGTPAQAADNPPSTTAEQAASPLPQPGALHFSGLFSRGDKAEKLYTAILNNDVKAVRKYAGELNPDFLRFEDGGHIYPFRYAVQAHRWGIARTLLAHRANINYKHKEHGHTNLIYMTKLTQTGTMELGYQDGAKGDPEAIDFLIENGADLDAQEDEGKNPTGKTALHYALELGHTEAGEKLIDAGAGFDIKDDEKNTALHTAINRGLDDLALRMLEQGGRKRAWVYDEDTGEEVQRPDGPGSNLNVPDAKGNTPLHLAAKTGNERVLAALIGKGAKLSLTNREGATPLALAIEANRYGAVKSLLENSRGENLLRDEDKAARYEGKTMLQLAADTDPRLARLVLTHDEHPMEVCSAGNTVLHNLLADLTPGALPAPDQVALMKALADRMKDEKIKDGAGVRNGLDATNNEGVTPLMLAVGTDSLEMVQYLLKLGAKTTINTPDGRTVFDFVNRQAKPAAGTGIKDVLLDVLGFNAAPVNGKAGISRSSQILEELALAWEFELDSKATRAFFKQVQEGNTAVVDATLKHGVVNVNARTRSGLTPLMLAVKLNDYKLFDLLIKHGADPTLTTRDGKDTAGTLAEKAGNARMIKKVNDAIQAFENT